jgi:hypothetical protein
MLYSFCTGTSMASPHVAGSAILITEQWRAQHAGATPSAAMVKALLVNGAVNMLDEDNNGATADVPVPNSLEGWGRVNLTNVLDPPLRVIARDQVTVFDDTGDTWTIRVAPVDATQPLKLTLTWSDAAGPGSGGSTGAWVNDLDLRATQGPTTWLGNVFAGGVSVTGGTSDTQNNVENVFLANPSGAYDVEVRATNVAGDGVPLAGDATDQDFAFVCSNCDQPPICDAGGPYLKECGGATTPIMLDATGSSDPDGDPISFAWSGPFTGGTATGATPTVVRRRGQLHGRSRGSDGIRILAMRCGGDHCGHDARRWSTVRSRSMRCSAPTIVSSTSAFRPTPSTRVTGSTRDRRGLRQ